MHPSNESSSRPFNSPMEVGLRCLYILTEIYPDYCDLQRLIFYDYLLVYSGDIEGGPPSLHPHIPNRGGGWLVRRQIIESGINLMFSKELIRKKFDENGITYSATELTKPFLHYLSSDYSLALSAVARWLAENIHSFSDTELSEFMKNNLDRWGAEFDKEALFRG